MNMNRRIAIVATLALFVVSCAFLKYPRNGIYLISTGYRGDVIILFNQPDGMEPKIENGLYVYEIPNDGILKVKTVGYTGIVDKSYFYVDSAGQRHKIPELLVTGDRNPKGGPQNKFGNISDAEFSSKVYVMATGGVATFQTANGSTQYSCFIVGTPKESDGLYDQMQKRISAIQRL